MLTRRQILAVIALADAPVPHEVTFYDERKSVRIDFAADMVAWRAWCQLLKVEEEWIRHQPYPLDSPTPRQETWSATVFDQWGGWRVALGADEPLVSPAADGPLPADTATQLADLYAAPGVLDGEKLLTLVQDEGLL